MRHGTAVALSVAAVTGAAHADELAAVEDITEVSIEALLEADVGVASRVPQTYRETPGVVTVITREQIMDSGARDLLDVLLLVPGFTAALDVGGVTGVGVRGNWAHEGKVLLLFDGQQMNETLYSTNQLGNRFPIDQIERIEIIRGPGSAIYGGYAELAVINVITRGAGLGGIAVYGHGGFMGQDLGHANLSVAAGDRIGPVELEVGALLGRGARSDAMYTDFYGDSYSLTEQRLDPLFVNAAARAWGASARVIYDGYRADHRDSLGENELETRAQGFGGIYGELRYDAALASTLTLTPRLAYTRQQPWRVTDPEAASFYDKTAERMTAGVSATWEPRAGIALLGGAEVYRDHAFLNSAPVEGTLQTAFAQNTATPTDAVTYYNEAVYAQALWNNRLANITLGARFEHHSAIGNSFVPRLAITKVVKPLHVKLLFAEAFRAPGFENINLAPSADQPVDPERTRVFEAELGYAIGEHQFATLNAYWMRTKDVIVYYVDADGEGYQNFEHTGTYGVEAAYQLRYAWGYLDANYSFYRAHDNQVPLYDVPGKPQLLLGMPAHKLALSGAAIWGRLRVAPSLVLTSGAYGRLLPGDGMGTGTIARADATALANVFVSYRDLGAPGVEIGVGGYNLLDDENLLLQPYDGGHAPMRGASRELLLRVGYTRGF